MMTITENTVVAAVGLGYVGLPLAVEFGKKYRTLGYDLSEAKIASHRNHCDPTGEVSPEGLKSATKLNVSTGPAVISDAETIVVAVPTPVDEAHIPDFSPLVGSSKTVDDLYESVIVAGILRASSIKIAEAAKVIENTQRDLNIALMNELAIIFDKISIDILEVLQAADTKWNFLPFRPGLVGGHYIGVDPYYLTHKAEMIGHNPQVILAGRRINDGMTTYVAPQAVKQMINAGSPINGAKVIVLGLTLKENCPDLRNSKVADVVSELREYGCDVSVHDPIASSAEADHEYGIKLSNCDALPRGDAVVIAVAHKEYLAMGLEGIRGKLNDQGVVIDVKSAFPSDVIRSLGYRV